MTKRPHPGSAHDALGRMIDSIGRSHGAHGAPAEGMAIAAAAIERTPSTLYKQLNPDSTGGGLTFDRVAQLTREFGCTEAAEYMAACAGGVFIPMPDDGDPVGLLTAEAMQEMGEAVAHLFASALPASEGGVTVTPAEARVALPKVRDVLIAVSNLFSRLLEKARGTHA